LYAVGKAVAPVEEKVSIVGKEATQLLKPKHWHHIMALMYPANGRSPDARPGSEELRMHDLYTQGCAVWAALAACDNELRQFWKVSSGGKS
jgi:hypothetical protein